MAGNQTDVLAAVGIPTAETLRDTVLSAGDLALTRLVVLAWAMGVALLSLHRIGGVFWLRRRVLAGAEPLPDRWLVRARTIAESLGTTSRVRFVQTDRAEVPFTFGVLRPVVVVPSSLLTGVPAAELDMLLMHELVHVRRLDYLAHLVQTAVECLLFYHPAIWWLSRRVRAERELACDAEVLSHDGDRLTYARALTGLVARRTTMTSGLAAAGGEMTVRIRSILKPGAAHPRPTWLAYALCLVGIGGGLLAACASDGESQPTDTPSSTAPTRANRAEESAALGIAWLPETVGRYEDLIVEASAREGVDPELVALMILVESAGDPEAVSPIGARGLMQLMPRTAEKVAAELDVSLSESDLDDPRTNLRLGVHLMARLLAKGEESDPEQRIHHALARYNAGSDRVDEWLEEGRDLPEETQRYTALLMDLHRQRHEATSSAYDAWQARIRARRNSR